jgi:SAM-dependent methyltransferase
MNCPICGSNGINYHPVIWDSLAREWELTPNQLDYINLQQGGHCAGCGAKVRAMALYKAIQEFMLHRTNQKIHGVEINELSSLEFDKSQFESYVKVSYPQVDMMKMPFVDNSFDLVLHSDTLEHISDPIQALKECKRILKPGGAVAFTVPLLVEKMTRYRDRLPLSLHGSPQAGEDYKVWSEFGADTWWQIVSAGFTKVTIHTHLPPAGIAFLISV